MVSMRLLARHNNALITYNARYFPLNRRYQRWAIKCIPLQAATVYVTLTKQACESLTNISTPHDDMIKLRFLSHLLRIQLPYTLSALINFSANPGMAERSLSISSYSIPDEKTLSESYSLPVVSHDGTSIRFGDLVSEHDATTVIVIFSRIL